MLEMYRELKKEGVELGMIVVPIKLQGVLERMGLLDLIGRSRIFESRYECVQAYLADVAEKAGKGTEDRHRT